MKFEDALKELKEGRYMRRIAWRGSNKYAYYDFVSDKPMYKDDDNGIDIELINLQSEMSMDDWEVIIN